LVRAWRRRRFINISQNAKKLCSWTFTQGAPRGGRERALHVVKDRDVPKFVGELSIERFPPVLVQRGQPVFM